MQPRPIGSPRGTGPTPAAVERFDADDLGAEISEHPTGQRAVGVGQIDDPEAGEQP